MDTAVTAAVFNDNLYGGAAHLCSTATQHRPGPARHGSPPSSPANHAGQSVSICCRYSVCCQPGQRCCIGGKECGWRVYSVAGGNQEGKPWMLFVARGRYSHYCPPLAVTIEIRRTGGLVRQQSCSLAGCPPKPRQVPAGPAVELPAAGAGHCTGLCGGCLSRSHWTGQR